MSDLKMMYVVHIDGDNSDPDYTGVTKIATSTGYEWRIVGPLAEVLKWREDDWRCRRVALEADAASARKGASINYDRAMQRRKLLRSIVNWAEQLGQSPDWLDAARAEVNGTQ